MYSVPPETETTNETPRHGPVALAIIGPKRPGGQSAASARVTPVRVSADSADYFELNRARGGARQVEDH